MATGGEIRRSAAVVAGWARYAEGVDEDGQPIDVVDRKRDSLTARGRRQREDPLAFLADRDLFGDLVDDERFTSYRAVLTSLHERGAARRSGPWWTSRRDGRSRRAPRRPDRRVPDPGLIDGPRPRRHSRWGDRRRAGGDRGLVDRADARRVTGVADPPLGRAGQLPARFGRVSPAQGGRARPGGDRRGPAGPREPGRAAGHGCGPRRTAAPAEPPGGRQARRGPPAAARPQRRVAPQGDGLLGGDLQAVAGGPGVPSRHRQDHRRGGHEGDPLRPHRGGTVGGRHGAGEAPGVQGPRPAGEAGRPAPHDRPAGQASDDRGDRQSTGRAGRRPREPAGRRHLGRHGVGAPVDHDAGGHRDRRRGIHRAGLRHPRGRPRPADGRRPRPGLAHRVLRRLRVDAAQAGRPARALGPLQADRRPRRRSLRAGLGGHGDGRRGEGGRPRQGRDHLAPRLDEGRLAADHGRAEGDRRPCPGAAEEGRGPPLALRTGRTAARQDRQEPAAPPDHRAPDELHRGSEEEHPVRRRPRGGHRGDRAQGRPHTPGPRRSRRERRTAGP
ncbi:hypothetical protein [Geodermatophilus sp. CPCC 205761]|uniref:mannitol dehydrogenase family protein n=1 Tax=Geodermatophilus sp. CPCC 205761 TaxID=2936597 RepID=UPI003F52E50B